MSRERKTTTARCGATIGGVSLMANNRPVQQQGSTTTWTKSTE